MPFTFSHPAAVLPLIRAKKSFWIPSALVIGSMAPDLLFFLPYKAIRSTTHGLGVENLNALGVGFLAFWIFHLFFKGPLVSLLPGSWQSSLQGQNGQQIANPVSLSLWVSLFVGVVSHNIWDGFTHFQTFNGEFFAWLRGQLCQSQGYVLTRYKLAQHLSTLFGGMIVFWFINGWKKKEGLAWKSFANRKSMSVLATFLVASVSALGCIWFFWKLPPWTVKLKPLLFGFVYYHIKASFLILIGFCCFWNLKNFRK